MKNILKAGEIKAIKDNFNPETSKIENNSIVLNSNPHITLRTNGVVIYGLFTEGDKRIRFTHNPKYPEPFVQDPDYLLYKEKVLKAWKESFNETAKNKYYSVQAIISKLKDLHKQGLLCKTQESQIETETKTIEKKEVEIMKNTNTNTKENTTMNNNTTSNTTTKDAKTLNIMSLAHIIRKTLNIKGHYHVQMKIAMKLAWEVKRGITTLDVLLNNTETTAAEATSTYNATPTVNEEPVAKEESVQEPINQSKFRFYLHSLNKGQAIFYCKNMNTGQAAPCFKMAAKNLIALDSEFAAKHLAKLLNSAPNNTVIEYYGDFTHITFMNSESLRSLAASKNITLALGVAPSGDVA